jgi:soluble lytic murein transglycosylase
VRSNWYAQRDADDGCTHAAGELYSYKKLSALDVWRKARLAAEANRPAWCATRWRSSRPSRWTQVKEVLDAPTKYLLARHGRQRKVRQELVLLALIKLATGDPDSAAHQLDSKWSVHLSPRSATGPGA